MSHIIWRIKLWIRTEARPVHWISMALIALIILGTVLPRLLWTFAHTDIGMTDGVYDYAYMDGRSGWRYRGRFRYFVGWAEDGRPVYAADKEGTPIRKRKVWYQDMDWNALYRTDRSFPDIYEDGCAVTVSIVSSTAAPEDVSDATKQSYRHSSEQVRLSPEGERAFQSVMKQLHAMKETGTVQQDHPNKTDGFVRFISIETPAFPELVYQPNVELFWIDGTIYAWFEEGYCMKIDPDSPLYAELKQYRDLYQ